MADYDPKWGAAIASIESGGEANPYTAVTPNPNGRRALGKYQVMAENVPSWTQEALGTSLSPEQFLNSPDAQEAVFKHRFGGYVNQYGSPQDAASAWFTGRPFNAQSAGAHDSLGTTGASYVSKFNKAMGQATDGPTAIQQAMHTQGSNGMPMAYADDNTGALSSGNTIGPGALAAGTRPNATPMGTDTLGYGGTSLHNRLLAAAAALQSAYNPQGAAVMNAQIKQATPVDQFTTTVAPDGSLLRVNSKTGAVEKLPGNYAKDDTADAVRKAHLINRDKSNSAMSDKIDTDAASSQSQLGSINQLRTLLQNPDVYQGAGGDAFQSLKKVASAVPGIDLKGVADADVARSIMNQMTLQMRNFSGGMPGSLSDKDVAFLHQMTPSLDNKPEANQQILDNIGRIHQRNIDVQKMRDQYMKDHGQIDDGFRQQVSAYANANPLFANVTTPPAQAAQSKSTAPVKNFKTTNGITWSIN